MDPELGGTRDIVITTPEVFDQLGRDRLNQHVWGCSTVSLQYFEKSRAPGGLDIKPWGGGVFGGAHVNLDVARVVYQELGGDYVSYEDAGDLLRMNRAAGGYWAGYELAKQMGLPWSDKLFIQMYNNYLHPIIAETKRGQFSTIQEAAVDTFSKLGGSYEDFLSHFPQGQEETTLTKFVEKMKDRGGIQIVYGKLNAKFDEFVKHLKVGFKFIDDQAVEITRPIPGKFVLAALPIGRYEQENITRT